MLLGAISGVCGFHRVLDWEGSSTWYISSSRVGLDNPIRRGCGAPPSFTVVTRNAAVSPLMVSCYPDVNPVLIVARKDLLLLHIYIYKFSPIKKIFCLTLITILAKLQHQSPRRDGLWPPGDHLRFFVNVGRELSVQEYQASYDRPEI